MALKLNEVAISKACSVKLDPETIAIVSLMYHTADHKAYPEDHSWYQYEARIAKIADIEAEIKSMKSLDNRLKKWKWPNPTWPAEHFMGYDEANEQGKGARWLQMKLKKAMEWPQYLKLVNEGIKKLGTGKEKRYAGAQYETTGYVSDDGQKDLTIIDREKLLSLCGHCLSKRLIAKRQLPKA